MHGQGELQRLGVGPPRAKRQAPAGGCVEPSALVVQQQRILARRRRELPLGQPHHRHRPEAQVAKLVDVQHVDAAPAERALVALVQVAGLERLHLGPHHGQEPAELDRGQQRVELGKRIEVAHHGVRVADVVDQDLAQVVQALRPGGALGATGKAVGQLLHERDERVAPLDPRLQPLLGRVVVGRTLLALAQRGQPRTPLLRAGHNPRAARQRVPPTHRCAVEPLPRLARHGPVGQEADHVAAAKRRLDQIEQRQHPPTKRALRERRAVVQVDGDTGLGERRLDDRPVDLSLPVRDHHLAERNALTRPRQARTGDLANLGRRVGRRDQHDGAVVGDRPIGCEQPRLDRGEGRGPLPLRQGLGRGAPGVEPLAKLPVRVVDIGCHGREEHDDGGPLGDRREQPACRRAQAPDADQQQGRPVKAAGVGHRQRVDAVVGVNARSGVALVQTGEVVGFGHRLRAAGCVSRDVRRSDVLLTELAQQPACGVGEAGGRRDRGEVAAASAGNLGDQRALGHRRKRPASRCRQGGFAEPHAELTERVESNVQEARRGL